MCIVLYIYIYIHTYTYIYISAIRCAKFGVAVFKASMLNWGAIGYGYICIVLYIYISAKFCVVVFMASLLE